MFLWTGRYSSNVCCAVSVNGEVHACPQVTIIHTLLVVALPNAARSSRQCEPTRSWDRTIAELVERCQRADQERQ